MSTSFLDAQRLSHESFNSHAIDQRKDLASLHINNNNIIIQSHISGDLLAQHYGGKERAIYYIGHTLVGYKLNHTSIEHVCLTIVFFL